MRQRESNNDPKIQAKAMNRQWAKNGCIACAFPASSEDAAEERPKELPFEEVVAPTAEEIEGRTTITLSETDTIW